MTLEERADEDAAIVESVYKAFRRPTKFIMVGVRPGDVFNKTARWILVVVVTSFWHWPWFMWRRAKMIAAVRELAPRAEIEIRWK